MIPVRLFDLDGTGPSLKHWIIGMLVAGLIGAIAGSFSSPRWAEDPQDLEESSELNVLVDDFMAGKAVKASEFPWFDPGTQRVDFRRLESAHARADINWPEFQAFRYEAEVMWQRKPKATEE